MNPAGFVWYSLGVKKFFALSGVEGYSDVRDEAGPRW